MNQYLEATYFLDSEQASVRSFAEENSDKDASALEKAVQLFYAVRDGFTYYPYLFDLRRESLKASNLLKKTECNCVEKAIILAASARAVAIPSRLSFHIVTNHIAAEKVERILQTNKLVFHGVTEFYLNDKWVKATPAFNRELCKFFNVEPLEFDGIHDAIFQQYDSGGNKFMEYLHDYGSYADMPYDKCIAELKKHYPHLFSAGRLNGDNLVLDLRELAASSE
jgi:hypothetical protein